MGPGEHIVELKMSLGGVVVGLGPAAGKGIEHHNPRLAFQAARGRAIMMSQTHREVVDQRAAKNGLLIKINVVSPLAPIGGGLGQREASNALPHDASLPILIADRQRSVLAYLTIIAG